MCKFFIIKYSSIYCSMTCTFLEKSKRPQGF
nr:MAG TPA: hypothetical protein [Caudoviricetes sp.]